MISATVADEVKTIKRGDPSVAAAARQHSYSPAADQRPTDFMSMAVSVKGPEAAAAWADGWVCSQRGPECGDATFGSCGLSPKTFIFLIIILETVRVAIIKCVGAHWRA